MSVLNNNPSHITIKYRYPIKRSDQIRPTDLLKSVWRLWGFSVTSSLIAFIIAAWMNYTNLWKTGLWTDKECLQNLNYFQVYSSNFGGQGPRGPSWHRAKQWNNIFTCKKCCHWTSGHHGACGSCQCGYIQLFCSNFNAKHFGNLKLVWTLIFFSGFSML